MGKITKIVCNKNNLLLFLIVFLSLVLRCININNIFGLWFDELFAVYISKGALFNIIYYLPSYEVHAPLYFCFLHFWIKFFGLHEISLKLSSVMFGVLNVVAVYFLGKELESKKLGLLTAFFVCFNSFLIYYSQEVKFYSLVPLLATLSVLFLVKILKNPSYKNLFLLMIINFALL